MKSVLQSTYLQLVMEKHKNMEIDADIVQISKNFFGKYIWFLNQ